jgi:hypothetical protein
MTASMVKWWEFLAADPEVRVLFPALQDFWEAVGLERGPLSLVSTTEDLLERKSSGSGPENRDYGREDPSRWPVSSETTGFPFRRLLRLAGIMVEVF